MILRNENLDLDLAGWGLYQLSDITIHHVVIAVRLLEVGGSGTTAKHIISQVEKKKCDKNIWITVDFLSASPISLSIVSPSLTILSLTVTLFLSI